MTQKYINNLLPPTQSRDSHRKICLWCLFVFLSLIRLLLTNQRLGKIKRLRHPWNFPELKCESGCDFVFVWCTGSVHSLVLLSRNYASSISWKESCTIVFGVDSGCSDWLGLPQTRGGTRFGLLYFKKPVSNLLEKMHWDNSRSECALKVLAGGILLLQELQERTCSRDHVYPAKEVSRKAIPWRWFCLGAQNAEKENLKN